MLGRPIDATEAIAQQSDDGSSTKLSDESIELMQQMKFAVDPGCETTSSLLPEFEIAQANGNWFNLKRNTAKVVAANASTGINQRFWALSSYANLTGDGRYGCAAAVSEKLQASGVPIADAALVSQVNDFLEDIGWIKEPINPLKPGCVAIGHTPGTRWRNGGGNAHLGIVDNDGRICNNESKGGGLWKCEPIADALRAKLSRRYQLCPPSR